jgi:Bacterial regulatory proteins, luxR family
VGLAPSAWRIGGRSWCDQQRAATSADIAVRLFEAGWTIDVREAARKTKCPVLIVHPERDVVASIEQGRMLARLIPQCHFVQLDSENHMPLADEPAWPELVAQVRDFLAEPECVRVTNGNALPLDELTSRERAVLEGIAEGLNNSEIAASLQLSEKRSATTLPGFLTSFALSNVVRPSCSLEKRASAGQAGSSTSNDRDICP